MATRKITDRCYAVGRRSFPRLQSKIRLKFKDDGVQIANHRMNCRERRAGALQCNHTIVQGFINLRRSHVLTVDRLVDRGRQYQLNIRRHLRTLQRRQQVARKPLDNRTGWPGLAQCPGR